MACSFLDRSQPAVPITLLTVSEARRSPGRAGVPHSEVRSTDETPPPAQRDATWVFERAGQAVMAKIMENEKAAAALAQTGPGRVAIPTINAPDLQKEAAKRKA